MVADMIDLWWSEFKLNFRHRACEWMCATIIFVFGIVLLHPTVTFDNSHTYNGMGDLFTEDTWGRIFYWVGLLRLVALAINGYFHPTYHIRTGLAVVSVGLFGMLSWCFLTTGSVGMWIAFAPVATVFDIWNAIRAAEDAAVADRKTLLAWKLLKSLGILENARSNGR